MKKLKWWACIGVVVLTGWNVWLQSENTKLAERLLQKEVGLVEEAVELLPDLPGPAFLTRDCFGNISLVFTKRDDISGELIKSGSQVIIPASYSEIK